MDFEVLILDRHTNYGGNKNGQKSLEYILAENCSYPSLKLSSPDLHISSTVASTGNYAAGDKITFAFATTHHQKLSQE